MLIKLLKLVYRFIFFKVNLKTVIFNFKVLPFNLALCTPIIISKKVYIREMTGKISIESDHVFFGMINIGYGRVGIFDDKLSRSILEISGSLIFKGSAKIGHGSKISVGKEGKLILGNGFTITAESSIVATNEITFGDNCLLSWEILIMDTDFHDIKNTNGETINPSKPIYIGTKVWICCRSVILKGSSIPNNSIIGANSLLNKKLEGESCLFGGNPARKIKEEVHWL